MLIPPRRIVLSGGGIRAIAHLGALEVLEQKNLLNTVQEYVGVSAGAFVGFCLYLGYTLKEMRMLCLLFDFSLIRNLDPELAFDFPTSFGFDNGLNLIKLFHSLLRIKNIPTSVTFEELLLYYPHMRFRCFATDLYDIQPREFSLKETPRVKIVDALRASMSLPGYFTPVKDPETGHLLVDGGLLHNFPIGFLKEDEKASAIGISFSYDHTTRVREIPDLLSFFSQMFACYYMPRTTEIHNTYKENSIIIANGDFPAWHFEATSEERFMLMEQGRKAAEEFLASRGTVRRKPARRFSVS